MRLAQQLAGLFVQLGFRVANDQRFHFSVLVRNGRLQNAVDTVSPRFHAAAGTVHRHIFVEHTFLRHTHIPPVQQPEDRAVMVFKARP